MMTTNIILCLTSQ